MFAYRRFDCICEYKNKHCRQISTALRSKNSTRITVLTQVNMSLTDGHFLLPHLQSALICSFLHTPLPHPPAGPTLSKHVQLGGWAIEFNIHTPSPSVEELPFFLTPEEITKLHSPMQTAISYGSTLEEFFSRILCFPLQIAPKEFVIIFFSMQVKNSSTFKTYP